MSIFDRIVVRYRSWQLGRDMHAGRVPHGRVPLGTGLSVTTAPQAKITARVIRADGSIEELPVTVREE